MATPLKGNKLYPEIPSSLLLSGIKRKERQEKENHEDLGQDIAPKKLKLLPNSDTVSSLKAAIEKECKIRDAANKFLELSKNNKQSMEASKGLFVSNMKILELMKDLQHIQDNTGSTELTGNLQVADEGAVEPCLAKIGLSDIRIPLEWKEFEQVKGKVDSSSKYGVFCLFRLGSQVIDTQTLVTVDRSMTDISFPDVVIFPKLVDADFCVKVEVYCSVPAESLQSTTPTASSSSSSGKASTPIKVLRKIKKDFSFDHLTGLSSPMTPSPSMVSLSPYVPRMRNATPTHNYALAGHTEFTLKDVFGECRTYNITVGAVGASGTAPSSSATGDQPLLPLWGQICCKIMAEPTCATQPRSTGFINLQQMVSGYPAWVRLWCVLRQQHLRCWSYPEDVGRKMPVKTIELTKEMSVENAPRLTMRRPNTLLLKDHETDKEIFLSFESKEERDQWSTALRQGIVDLKVWKDSTNYIIQTKASKYYNENEFDVHPGFSSNARNNSIPFTRTAETTVL